MTTAGSQGVALLIWSVFTGVILATPAGLLAAPADAPSLTWTAQVVSADTEFQLANFRAGLSSAAARAADKLRGGERVVLRWRRDPGTEARIVGVRRATPEAAHERVGRDEFTLTATFVALNTKTRQIRFSMQTDDRVLARLASFEMGASVQVTSPIDDRRAATGILTIEPRRRALVR